LAIAQSFAGPTQERRDDGFVLPKTIEDAVEAGRYGFMANNFVTDWTAGGERVFVHVFNDVKDDGKLNAKIYSEGGALLDSGLITFAGTERKPEIAWGGARS